MDDMIMVSNETTTALAKRINDGTLSYEDAAQLILIGMRAARMKVPSARAVLAQLRADYPSRQQLLDFVRRDLLAYVGTVTPAPQSAAVH